MSATYLARLHKFYPTLIGSLGLLFFQCTDTGENHGSDTGHEDGVSSILDVPKHFPYPEIPDDNQITAERVQLGRLLFYDPILSRDTSISCGSCHFQERAFTTPDPVAIGIDGKRGFRNAITLANVGYQKSFFHDGGVPTLEMQVLVPVEDSTEMDLSFPLAAYRLKKIPEYVKLSKKAYGREPDPFVITRAIAAFERTMISGNSRYDKYLNGDKSALSENEIAGMELFFSDKTSCSSCHSGFNLTDGSYRNKGLYKTYKDTGRARITMRSSDVGLFKVPTLRNIELTSPYMHDGSMSTLDEVIQHCNKGGEGHSKQDSLIRPLNLSLKEQEELILFLKTLTDSSFIEDPRFSEPKRFYR